MTQLDQVDEPVLAISSDEKSSSSWSEDDENTTLSELVVILDRLEAMTFDGL